MTGSEMFYTREWSILRMFYTSDFMHKEISVTSKMFYFMVPLPPRICAGDHPRVGYTWEMNFDPLARRHIFGLFSGHVFKMKFDPLSNCSKNELRSTFDFRSNHWYESGAKVIVRTFWKWIKLLYTWSENNPKMWHLANGSKFISHVYQSSYRRVLQMMVTSTYLKSAIWSFSFSRAAWETNIGKYEFSTPSFLISVSKKSLILSQIAYEPGNKT